MRRRSLFGLAALPFAILAAAASAADPVPPPSPPAALASRFAASVLAAAKKVNARAVRVDVVGAEGLEETPALTAISQKLGDDLFGPSRLTPAGGAAPADLEIVARLARVRGRIALGGAVTAHGVAIDWVLASDEETPSWWPWLSAASGAPPPSNGFLWRHSGNLSRTVEDADAGDVDGDGSAEFAAATAADLYVFRVSLAGPEAIGSIGLDEGPAVEPAETATRSPRTFVRVIEAQGGPGEIWVRRTDERRTRVYGWESGRIVRRADRDGLTLVSRLTAKGAELITAELQPGTNRFEAPPSLKRSGAVIRTLDELPWIDLRPAALTARARLGETGARFGWLEASGELHLLGADLAESGRVRCGAAFAVADLDDDGAGDVICAGDGSGPGDRLSVFLSPQVHTSAAWNVTLDGVVSAVAAGPTAVGGAAIAFVATPDGSTDVWLFRRSR